MKRKKTLNVMILLTLLTPTIINAKEYIVCGTDKKFPTVIATLISTAYVIIKILVPILLVISGILSFLKVTFSNNVDESLDKAKKKFVSNLIAAIIIFFIASIINFVIGLVASKNNSFTDCMYCMLHPKECQQIDSKTAALCPGLLSDQDKYNSDCTLKDPDKKGEKIDYSYTGETGVPAYSNTIAKAGGGAIARTLRDNPDGQTSENIVLRSYEKYNYYLYIPKQVDSNNAALIVYLHGNGQQADANPTRGIKATLEDDLSFLYQANHGVEFNCYVLMPQAPTLKWDSAALKRLIDYEVEQNRIDKSRIHLIGFSWGANSTPTVIHELPNYFATATMVSVNKDLTAFTKEDFQNIPTLFVTGSIDKNGHGTGTYPFYESLKNKYNNSCYREYAGKDHGGLVGELINDKQLNCGRYNTYQDWVLDQRRTD